MARSKILGRSLLVAIAATSTMHCASASGPTPMAKGDRINLDGDIITMAALRRLDQGLTAMETLERIRPEFLHPRGSVPAVSLDGAPATDLSVLRTIRIAEVSEIRFVRGMGGHGAATIRPDASVVVGDVIQVVTRKGPE